ncbi:MAG: hypothetical protein K9G41_04060 [Flavobacteriales bacterium]|nr:hypothetical protein [Flavobacteriales bacterium]
MRQFLFLSLIIVSVVSCKNNGQSTGQTKTAMVQTDVQTVKEIIIDNNRTPVKPDFSVLEMSNENDVLTVIVRYGGGCEEHDFNAYFSGGWAKSLPPQAAITLEHLNPNNDRCRALVFDTLRFNMKPLQYSGGKEVVVKWSSNPEIQTNYRYGK